MIMMIETKALPPIFEKQGFQGPVIGSPLMDQLIGLTNNYKVI
jgi:hypothetical protein